MRDRLPYRGRTWTLGVVLPVLVTAAAAALVVAWLPRLPRPAAVHWGRDGVDAVGSVTGLWAVHAVYGGLGLLLFGALSLTVGRTALVRRTVLGLATGVATLNAGLLLAFVHVQLDLADARDAGDPGSRVLVAVLVAVAAGAAAAAAAGEDPHLPATGPLPPAASAAVPEGTTVWRRRVRMTGRAARGWVVAGGLLVALAVGLSLASGSWWVGALLLLPVPAVLLTADFLVVVAPDGLTVRGRLGWPSQHVPADEIEAVEVVEVDPFAQFGGWGLRVAPDLTGTVGVVLRRGEGLAVQRSGGRRFVVTVDDAAAGAALLTAYARRARSTR